MSDKEKKYYWLKLDRHFFKRHDIRIIEDMPKGKEYVLFFMKLLAESIDHVGELRFNELIPYDDTMLATITNTDLDVVRSAITLFKKLKLIEIWDDKTIFVYDTAKMIGEQKSTERVRRLREKRLDQLSFETECNVTETLHETEKEKEKELEKELDTETEGILKDLENENTQSDPLTELIDLIQSEFKRPISAFEIDKVRYWFDLVGYDYIIHGLRQCLIYGKKDINYLDKVLVRWTNDKVTLEMLNKGEKNK